MKPGHRRQMGCAAEVQIPLLLGGKVLLISCDDAGEQGTFPLGEPFSGHLCHLLAQTLQPKPPRRFAVLRLKLSGLGCLQKHPL